MEVTESNKETFKKEENNNTFYKDIDILDGKSMLLSVELRQLVKFFQCISRTVPINRSVFNLSAQESRIAGRNVLSEIYT